MLPCNMIRSRQPRPATSSSLRRLPLAPLYCTYRPILCLSPLPTSPNSTHPPQLDTPVPSQPPCYQSHPHAFRHTWGCASVSTFNFELSTLNRSFHKSRHQYHSAPLSRPLFSYSYALFCHGQNSNFRILNRLRTLCTKHPGWGSTASGESFYSFPVLLHVRERSVPSTQVHASFSTATCEPVSFPGTGSK
jgi:hypothetical protein